MQAFRPVTRAGTAIAVALCGVNYCSAQFSELYQADYALLFQGGGNNTLQVTNVAVTGNVGVGRTGKMTDSGPSTITGAIDFFAPNSGQFSNNNANNVISGGVHYGVNDPVTGVNASLD